MARTIFSVAWGLLCLFVAVLVKPLVAQQEQQPLQAAAKARPNILFILTDDQDLHMDSLSYMPNLKRHLIERGSTFTNHYCTVALCCPSRVSLWTGKAAHNTNVTDLHPPWGGYPKFVSQGFNEDYLPVWLQAAGYNTYYVGKLFNAHTVDNYHSPHAAGWTGSDFLLDPFTYRYLNATFQRNHDKPVNHEGSYSTDVVVEKAHGFLDDAINAMDEKDEPFFLTVAPIAPHSDVIIRRKIISGQVSNQSATQAPPIPADRHKHLFEDAVVPRTPNFNPDTPGGASWIAKLPQQDEENVEYNDDWYRNRLRTLQVVDEMVESLISRLSEAGILENTYIFYSTDNGYSIGQHRRQPGKQCAFEEDINVPLIVRGPGIPQGLQRDLVTTHTDLAPTFLSLANAAPPSKFELDGQAIPLSPFQPASNGNVDAVPASVLDWPQEHVNVEMWGIIMSEGKYGMVQYPNHTYKALRIVGRTYNLLYTIWCSNEHELYDMTSDPYQLVNLYNTNEAPEESVSITHANISEASCTLIQSLPLGNTTSESPNCNAAGFEKASARSPLVHRLDALLMVLKTCVGRQCTHPWESLFPSGKVRSLTDALDSKYDDFFANGVDRVQFTQCERGYIAESEGPMWDGTQAFPMYEEMAYR